MYYGTGQLYSETRTKTQFELSVCFACMEIYQKRIRWDPSFYSKALGCQTRTSADPKHSPQLTNCTKTKSNVRTENIGPTSDRQLATGCQYKKPSKSGRLPPKLLATINCFGAVDCQQQLPQHGLRPNREGSSRVLIYITVEKSAGLQTDPRDLMEQQHGPPEKDQ